MKKTKYRYQFADSTKFFEMSDAEIDQLKLIDKAELKYLNEQADSPKKYTEY